jgi:hypothetical protein
MYHSEISEHISFWVKLISQGVEHGNIYALFVLPEGMGEGMFYVWTDVYGR